MADRRRRIPERGRGQHQAGRRLQPAQRSRVLRDPPRGPQWPGHHPAGRHAGRRLARQGLAVRQRDQPGRGGLCPRAHAEFHQRQPATLPRRGCGRDAEPRHQHADAERTVRRRAGRRGHRVQRFGRQQWPDRRRAGQSHPGPGQGRVEGGRDVLRRQPQRRPDLVPAARRPGQSDRPERCVRRRRVAALQREQSGRRGLECGWQPDLAQGARPGHRRQGRGQRGPSWRADRPGERQRL